MHKNLEKIAKIAARGKSIINGIVGDKIQNTALAIKMNFYEKNKVLDLEKESLVAFNGVNNPKNSAKICIFIHGLTENETTWTFKEGMDYGSLLNQDFDMVPFYLRYNTGLHISENGQTLAALIEKLLQNYPIPIQEISIIAHSMGGLLTHSACHYAQDLDLEWVSKVKNVFLLATPHLGSFLEKFANLTTNILEKIPNFPTRLVGKAINLRSAGIKDLRYGYIKTSDWAEKDPDVLFENNKTTAQKLPENVSYYLISARMTEAEKHWVSLLLGDMLVSTSSAISRSKSEHELRFPEANHYEFAKTFHFELTRAPKVYEKISHWLAPPQ